MRRRILHLNARSAAEHRHDNQRKSKRFPTLQRAWIVISGEEPHFCTVVDMSARGAQVKVNRAEPFPLEFTLIIAGDTFTKSIPVSLRWSRGGRVGVSFLSDGVLL